MDKMSTRMLRQILECFTHMPDINDEAVNAINAEIERIKQKIEPKKKENAEDAVKPEKNLGV